jgi:hypothetical protein
MTVEACVAYFGIVLAGCAVVSIADSFAPAEIAARLRIVTAKAVFTQVRPTLSHPLLIFIFPCLLSSFCVCVCVGGGGGMCACVWPLVWEMTCDHTHKHTV